MLSLIKCYELRVVMCQIYRNIINVQLFQNVKIEVQMENVVSLFSVMHPA